MTININVEKTGFPVKIGSIELFFDASVENLRKFFDVDEIAQEKMKEAQEKAQHIHFPDNLKDIKIEDVDVKSLEAAIDVNKDFIAAQYDIIFGEGTFEKVYKVYPDMVALENALEPIGVAISKEIENMEFQRSELIEAEIDKAVEKKDKKQKNIKAVD